MKSNVIKGIVLLIIGLFSIINMYQFQMKNNKKSLYVTLFYKLRN